MKRVKALARLKNAKAKKFLVKTISKQKVRRTISKVKKWTDSVPENHQYKLWVLKGLEKELKGNLQGAIMLFEKAAIAAEKQKFTHNAAICYKLMSEACHNIGYSVRSAQYKIKSKELFENWGFKQN